jgi:transposase
VRAADTVPTASRGWDNGKKVGGRKRHIAVDCLGLLLAVVVTAASTQDRDGAHPLLVSLRERSSTIGLVWADGGYAGRLVTWAVTTLRLTVTVIKPTDDMTVFVVLPRRWVVERTFAWISKYRRCVRDYETLPAHHEAYGLPGNDHAYVPSTRPHHGPITRVLRLSLRVAFHPSGIVMDHALGDVPPGLVSEGGSNTCSWHPRT